MLCGKNPAAFQHIRNYRDQCTGKHGLHWEHAIRSTQIRSQPAIIPVSNLPFIASPFVQYGYYNNTNSVVTSTEIPVKKNREPETG